MDPTHVPCVLEAAILGTCFPKRFCFIHDVREEASNEVARPQLNSRELRTPPQGRRICELGGAGAIRTLCDTGDDDISHTTNATTTTDAA